MSKPDQAEKEYHYLALGDSYTIGEMVLSKENFPNQVISMMNTGGLHFLPSRIVAKTGWTTDELKKGIEEANLVNPFLATYDLVSLLIGVNNQYRGYSVDEYKPGFESLLKQALVFAGNQADRVVVLSIPDWGVTPFAEGRDRKQISLAIDFYNASNKLIAEHYGVHYIDITPWSREAAADHSLLTSDGLHPSAKEYRRWAESIVFLFKRILE